MTTAQQTITFNGKTYPVTWIKVYADGTTDVHYTSDKGRKLRRILKPTDQIKGA